MGLRFYRRLTFNSTDCNALASFVSGHSAHALTKHARYETFQWASLHKGHRQNAALDAQQPLYTAGVRKASPLQGSSGRKGL